MANNLTKEDEKLFTGIVLMNARLLGLVLGVVFGAIIFVATVWVVIRGGHVDAQGNYVVGPHLQLLSQFFIGYRVSLLGAVIGFFYGFAVGTINGAIIGWVYNRIVRFRN